MVTVVPKVMVFLVMVMMATMVTLGDIGNGLGDDENNTVDSKGDVSELDDKIVFWNLGQLILLRFTKVSSVLSSATSGSVPMISMQSKSIYVCYHIIMNVYKHNILTDINFNIYIYI